MNAEQTRRRKSHWMIVTIAVLAFAVFSWGVRYKLSLYNPVTHMSAAKLLSQRERPATFEATKLAADPLPDYGAATMFVFTIGALLARFWSPKAAAVRNLTSWDVIPRQLSQNFSYFFFRPPPVIFASF
jgi:hypothetical protein